MSSLRYQFVSSIDNAFSPNLNKHSYKKQGCGKQKVASYQYRRNLLDFANCLISYLNVEYPDIKNLKDIKRIHIYSFFKEKEKTCSHRTLTQYRSYINVLDKCITQNFHFKIHMANGVPEINKENNKVRNLYMRQDHIDSILELKKNSKSPALIGLRISNLFGLRAKEIVTLRPRDFNLEKEYLKVIGKGGKTRYIKFETKEQKDLAEEILFNYVNDEKLVPIRADTYNSFIRNSLHELNIHDYDKAKTGNHAIRKKVAKEEIERNINNGMTIEEAYENETKRLGHNRTSVIKSAYTCAE